jgi:EmrB/QacA subfamily drug resistance transporter
MLMIILDATVVNVALPSIKGDLGFSQASLAWVVNAYLITFGGLLLLSGRLGDLVGRRKVFVSGLALFTIASMLCGVSQSQEMLVGARLLQGVGGALTSAVILGMIVTMFPEPREQAKAIGIFSFVASSGGSIGLLAGGILTSAINWHWIFFVNLPIALAALFFARRVIEDDKGIGFGGGADIPGAALITSALMLGVYTIVKVPDHGWGATQTVLLGAISVGLLVGFIWRQATAENPLMPLRIFRSRNVSGANAIQVLTVAGMFGMFFLGSLYLERVLGFSAIEIGLAFLPVTVAIGALSLGFSERLIMRFGPKKTLLPGLGLIAVGLGLFSQASVHGSYVSDVLPSMLLLGIGAGLSFPSMMTLAMSGATEHDSGLASGLVNTTQQVGGALGLSVLATLSTTRSDKLIAQGHSAVSALTDGYQLAFGIGAVLVAVALVIAFTVLDGTPRAEEPQTVDEPVGEQGDWQSLAEAA